MQNILVVEDDHDLNQAICYSLKKSGYGTYGAESAESGRTEFLRNRIDLVLLDVNLPDGEGFSFLPLDKKQEGNSGYLSDSQRYGRRCADGI